MSSQADLDLYISVCAQANAWQRHARKRAQEGSHYALHWQNVADDWALIAESMRPAPKT